MEQILNFAKNLSHEEMVSLVKKFVSEEKIRPEEIFTQEKISLSLLHLLAAKVQFSARPGTGVKLDFGGVGFWVYKELKHHDRYGSLSPLEAAAFAARLPEIDGGKWHIMSALQGKLFNLVRHQFNEFARANGFPEVIHGNFVVKERAMAASPCQMQTYVFTAEV